MYVHIIGISCDNADWVDSLVEKKLLGGVRVKDYVPSFGERSNDAKTAAQCKCSCHSGSNYRLMGGLL